MKFYVYVLKSSSDSQIFYVGKGSITTNRYEDHLREAASGKRTKKCCKIRKLQREGHQVLFEIVYRTDDEDDALKHEDVLIDEIGLGNLTNTFPGGGYASAMSKWHKMMKNTPEYETWRANMSASMKRRCELNPDSDETRKKKSEAQKRLWEEKKHNGYAMSDESKAKVSVAQRGIPKTAEHRRKLSEAVKLTLARKREQSRV